MLPVSQGPGCDTAPCSGSAGGKAAAATDPQSLVGFGSQVTSTGTGVQAAAPAPTPRSAAGQPLQGPAQPGGQLQGRLPLPPRRHQGALSWEPEGGSREAAVASPSPGRAPHLPLAMHVTASSPSSSPPSSRLPSDSPQDLEPPLRPSQQQPPRSSHPTLVPTSPFQPQGSATQDPAGQGAGAPGQGAAAGPAQGQTQVGSAPRASLWQAHMVAGGSGRQATGAARPEQSE
ncbi:hypothetical protein V8C86DRAFT_2625404, partial [Haematococcus lacustris]